MPRAFVTGEEGSRVAVAELPVSDEAFSDEGASENWDRAELWVSCGNYSSAAATRTAHAEGSRECVDECADLSAGVVRGGGL